MGQASLAIQLSHAASSTAVLSEVLKSKQG